MSNPALAEAKRADLTARLKAARREVRGAKTAKDRKAEVAARKNVDEVMQAFGERGPVWWDDGSPDLNRHMARTTSYADWCAGLARAADGGL